MSVPNRQTVRDALTALLTTALGTDIEAIYGYQQSDIGGESPVVMVLSDGSSRAQAGSQLRRNQFRLSVLVFVIDADTGASWTDENVENTLDALELIIAQTVNDNRKTSDWASLDFDDGFTTITPAKVGGVNYKMETITLIVTISNR